MENNLISNRSQQPSPESEIAALTNKILWKTQQAQRIGIEYAIEIGGYLREAKALLPHGEWGNWLKDKVNYSQSTANNFMKLHEEYENNQLDLFSSNSQSLTNLTYTKALKLLMIPSEEREQFVEENNVDELSTRELDKLIKERDEARKKAELAERLEEEKAEAQRNAEFQLKRSKELEEQLNDHNNMVNSLNEQVAKAKLAEKKAKDKLKQLKENPTIPQEVTDRLKAEAEEKAAAQAQATLEKKIADANSQIEAVTLAKQAAERDVAKAQKNIAELERKISLSDEKVIRFKALFEQLQETLSKMKELNTKIASENPEKSLKLQQAVVAVFNKFTSEA